MRLYNSTFVFMLLAYRYLHDRERLPEAANNMKKMLTYLKNLPMKKMIAEQLGMNDVLQVLIGTYKEGFLNDVAKL